MEINSLISSARTLENRRLAIQKSWTDAERIERLTTAIKLQERLVEIPSVGHTETKTGLRILKIAS